MCSADDADEAWPVIYDSLNFYFLGYGYAAANDNIITGHEPDWHGPMQPYGSYHNVDLLVHFNNYFAGGFFRDYYGEPVYEQQFGWVWSDDGDDLNYNEDHLQLV
jgi:hypothetical protein